MQASRSRESAPDAATPPSAAVPTATPTAPAPSPIDERELARHAPYMDLFRGCKLVLDVCCGSGACLELLRERSVDAIGIDPDAALAGRCTKRGLPARALLPLELDRIQGPFDGI